MERCQEEWPYENKGKHLENVFCMERTIGKSLNHEIRWFIFFYKVNDFSYMATPRHTNESVSI